MFECGYEKSSVREECVRKVMEYICKHHIYLAKDVGLLVGVSDDCVSCSKVYEMWKDEESKLNLKKTMIRITLEVG